jgi:hypothetical protein
VHHPGTVCLTWVDSSSDNDSLLFPVLLKVMPVRDSQVFALVTGDRPAQSVPCHMGHLFRLDVAQIVCQHCVSVRNRISEVDSVKVVLKRVAETKCVIAALLEA